MAEKNDVTVLEEATNFVWDNFVRLFPSIILKVLSHERAGSKMIKLYMNDGSVLWFLYYNPTNWNLGTKPWRMKPKGKEERKVPENGIKIPDEIISQIGGGDV